jgi:ParB-like chromosome segregation protein Spo0J
MPLLYAFVPRVAIAFAASVPDFGFVTNVRPVRWIGLDHDGASTVSAPQSFPIDKIHVPEKKWKALKPGVVQDLAESILNVGQQDAILVRREKDHFVLVDGLHRLEACKALGERAILGLLISAEAARHHPLPPLAPDPEREKMERLRKLRLEKEAAEKLASEAAITRQREPAVKTTRSSLTASSKQSRAERSGSAPRTLSDWIKQQERSGGRF